MQRTEKEGSTEKKLEVVLRQKEYWKFDGKEVGSSTKKNILQLEVGSGAPTNANSTKQKHEHKYNISQYRRYRVLAGSLTSTTSTRWNCSIFPNRIVVTP